MSIFPVFSFPPSKLFLQKFLRRAYFPLFFRSSSCIWGLISNHCALQRIFFCIIVTCAFVLVSKQKHLLVLLYSVIQQLQQQQQQQQQLLKLKVLSQQQQCDVVVVVLLRNNHVTMFLLYKMLRLRQI